jgi:DNA-3-methyladenine glycosylase
MRETTTTRLRPFERAALADDPLDAARALIGAYLVRGERVGRIVEVEAYVGTGDGASHARFGRTTRNRVMWGEAGRAYVYLVYGMYDCLNVVVAPIGQPAAVLVRAVEPLAGVAEMRAARAQHSAERRRSWTPERQAREADRLAVLAERRLASGPGAVAAAFSIDRRDTGVDLCDRAADLRLAPAAADEQLEIAATARVGIDYADEPWRSMPWRFVDPASASLSGPSARAPRTSARTRRTRDRPAG